ncbi:parallel beta helix pectate lyase-like protein [Thiogranum longum]|uniref:Parallel beta helix pectate lyase-like protein n=1 Tax=Thiogranum longum TaxID=1537524 RepID=A0A4R1HF42_9GAMM|nr:right-handed parallel beta-helix repeat-containing protein [Thiogranum longum]TCK18955.1 parallel beta helix pectate lyase-like protein [Thiogranum longum]
MRYLAVWILLVSTMVLAETRPGGDLAPLGNPDGVRNAGDLVVLTRLVQGNPVPTERQKRIGDVAPLGSPDGVLNAADILVLTRALLGQVTLPDVYVGPDAPVIGSLPDQSTTNPVTASGNALPGEEVRVYVNGVLQQSSQASVTDGSFSVGVQLDDGANSIYFTAWDGLLESQPSASVTVNYTNTIARNQVDTYIAANTVWTAGNPVDPYIVSGDLVVAAGATLYIQPGAVLQFESGASLRVSGGLELLGTTATPIQFTSTASIPRTGDWQGVLVDSGATNVTIRNASIEWADIGIDVIDLQTLALESSAIKNSKTAGIWMRQGSGGNITNTQVEYSGSYTGTTYTSKAMGMRLTGASPTITGCSFRYHSFGMYIEQGSSPVINGTTFSDNNNGLGVFGDYSNVANNPSPTIKRNAFYNNSQRSYVTDGYVDPTSPLGASLVGIEQDLSENWWGSTDPSVISAGIYDYARAQGFNAPITRLVPFLDAENGSPVPGNYLNGLISQSTTLPAGTTYTVLGAFVVANTAVLTIDEGAQLLFAADSILSARGNLWVNGTTANPARFDALSTTPQAGEWLGISLYANGNRVAGADIRFATSAIQVLGSNTTVVDSKISDFSRDGVRVANGVIQAEVSNNTLNNTVQSGTGISFDTADGVVRDNSVDNADSGIYARLTGAAITNNRVINNNNGINISGDVPAGFTAAPTISGNLVSNNNYGINITKYGNLDDVNPVIRNNRIYGNTTYNYFINGFGDTSVLDATLNWWGSEDESVILAGLNSNQIQYSPYLNSLGEPVYSARVDGVLSQNTVWSAANGSYTLTDSVFVPAGIQLTIEPGSVVRFPPGARLVVNGDLDLQTTEAAPALLTSTIDNPATADYWGGLLVNSTNKTIHHLQVENVQTGVEVNATNVSVKYNTFTNCSSRCIYYSGNTDSYFTGNIENNRITVNNRSSGRGIWAAFYDATIQGNHV